MSIVKTHGSLFSGIGGFDLAAERVGWHNVFQVEKDPFCTAVLNKNFPNVKRYGDIKQVDFRPYRDTIHCLSGGFPCQPFSDAGQRKGINDDRYLWPENERAIDEIRPTWYVGENVVGITNLALDLVCSSLESKDYAVWPFIIPASALGAWQRRARVWIVANNTQTGTKDGKQNAQGGNLNQGGKSCAKDPIFTNAFGERYEISGLSPRKETRQDVARDYWTHDWVEIVSKFCRDPPRVPGRVDRITALGNSIVPQVATEIFKIINEIE